MGTTWRVRESLPLTEDVKVDPETTGVGRGGTGGTCGVLVMGGPDAAPLALREDCLTPLFLRFEPVLVAERTDLASASATATSSCDWAF